MFMAFTLGLIDAKESDPYPAESKRFESFKSCEFMLPNAFTFSQLYQQPCQVGIVEKV
jgi:hypothetical protein